MRIKHQFPPYRSYIDLFFLIFIRNEGEVGTSKIVSKYDQEIPQSQTAEYPVALRGSSITRHQEDKLSKATSSFFPIKIIAILEWT